MTKHVQQNNTQSIFVSWSKDKETNWDLFSKPGSIQLRVDATKISNYAIDVSQWSHFPEEAEVTIIGAVPGVERIR